jgi:predicted glycosyltransferase
MFDIGHPAHVHCGDYVAATPTLVGGIFKNTIWELEKKGHQVKVTA